MSNMIDTLAASRILVSAGFKAPQAEALVKIIGEANDNLRETLVTSAAFESASASLDKKFELKTEGLDKKIEIATADLKAAIATAKADTIKWFFGSQVALFGALAVLQHIKF